MQDGNVLVFWMQYRNGDTVPPVENTGGNRSGRPDVNRSKWELFGCMSGSVGEKIVQGGPRRAAHLLMHQLFCFLLPRLRCGTS